MLTQVVERVSRQPGPAMLAFALGTLPGMLAAYVLTGGSNAASPAVVALQPPVRTTSTVVVTTPSAPAQGSETTQPTTSENRTPVIRPAERTAFVKALKTGAKAAQSVAGGGAAEVGVWVDTWPEPIIDTSYGGDISMRMWSTGKPPTAIAVLQAAGDQLNPYFDEWMKGAIERSENCPWRAMVLYLQDLSGGSPLAATQRFEAVLAHAGAKRVRTYAKPASLEGSCARAERSMHLPSRLGEPAPQFGVTTWHIEDAVRFAFALGGGRYDAAGDAVLKEMRQQKSPSTELIDPKRDYTPDPNWGAGTVFAGWDPAYKAGWGGLRKPGNFMLAQYVVLNFRGHNIAIAAAFHPNTQPTLDDPGQNNADQAIVRMLDPIRAAIEMWYGGSR